jgi:hypothetical protein
MSDDTKTTETPAAGGNRPTHIAYQIRDGKDEGIWTRIGAAWRHKDGKGFNLQLDAVPLDGRITLREASETKA